MNPAAAWLTGHGLVVPARGDLAEAAVAGGFVLASLFAGVLAQRTLAPRLADWWQAHAGHVGNGIGPRMGLLVRHGTAALLLGITEAAWPWHPLAGLLVGVALGAAAALAAQQLMRGLSLPRWMSWVAAAVLFVALFSHAVGGLAPITGVLDRVGFDVGKRRFSLLALVAIVVTAVTLVVAVRLVNRVLGHAITRSRGLDPTQKLLAQKLSSLAVAAVAFFVGIDLFDIDLTAFAVFGGALGLAVGFGLQKTFGNLIAGIILLMDRSIKPGDVIVVGDKDVGWVNKIGVRAVSIITRDGKEHLIPNENLMTQAVENWSYSDRNVRVRIPLVIAYDCDLDLVRDLMMKAATDSPRVLASPKPNIWVTAFGGDGVEHEILVWISDPESGIGNVRSDVLRRLWVLFRDAGIKPPNPQRDVTISAVPDLRVGPTVRNP